MVLERIEADLLIPGLPGNVSQLLSRIYPTIGGLVRLRDGCSGRSAAGHGSGSRVSAQW